MIHGLMECINPTRVVLPQMLLLHHLVVGTHVEIAQNQKADFDVVKKDGVIIVGQDGACEGFIYYNTNKMRSVVQRYGEKVELTSSGISFRKQRVFSPRNGGRGENIGIEIDISTVNNWCAKVFYEEYVPKRATPAGIISQISRASEHIRSNAPLVSKNIVRNEIRLINRYLTVLSPDVLQKAGILMPLRDPLTLKQAQALTTMYPIDETLGSSLLFEIEFNSNGKVTLVFGDMPIDTLSTRARQIISSFIDKESASSMVDMLNRTDGSSRGHRITFVNDELKQFTVELYQESLESLARFLKGYCGLLAQARNRINELDRQFNFNGVHATHLRYGGFYLGATL